MMTPPKAAAAWDMEVLGEEQRDGYKAQKIAFNINAYSRITAYLLIPDSEYGKNSNVKMDFCFLLRIRKLGNSQPWWRSTTMVPISLSERRR